MKALAKNYLWWPHLDADLKELCHNCQECRLNSAKPPSAPAHPWIIPQERLHIDHAQWGEHLLLISVDAFAKWPEVNLVSATSATQTIDN